MSEQKLTRQQIYQQIQETGKNEHIQAEMERLGFWQKDKPIPVLPEKLVFQRNLLIQKLRGLGQQQRLYSDPEKALAELHRQRKVAALEKREQTKLARHQKRYEKAISWHQKQQTGIYYLGDGFSYGLEQRQQNTGRLASQELPLITNSKALAEYMGISINELRFLCYQKDVSKVCHYQQFTIAKKTGGARNISAPMPRLKRSQYWILDNILNKVKLHDAVHGFVKGRNILSNALPHVKKSIVVNLDMENFFPTISYRRVKGMFCQLGYSEHVGTLLSLLCTEPDNEQVALDDEVWFVQQGERYLPQGAPTSPAISNIICRRLDSRLSSMAEKLGFSYSRYADDVTFSCHAEGNVQQLLWRCKQIIQDEGFKVHPDKTRVMRHHQHQEVTGVVVNEKPSIDRATLKRFRALLFQIRKDGFEGKQWGQCDLISSIEGYANFIAMVSPEKGWVFKEQITELKLQNGYRAKFVKSILPGKRAFRLKSAKGEAPHQNWWQATPAPEPVLASTAQQLAKKKNTTNAGITPRLEKNASKAGTALIVVGKDNSQLTKQGRRKISRWIFVVLLIALVVLYINDRGLL